MEKITNNRSGENLIEVGDIFAVDGKWHRCVSITDAEDFGDGNKRYNHNLEQLPTLDALEKIGDLAVLKVAKAMISKKQEEAL